MCKNIILVLMYHCHKLLELRILFRTVERFFKENQTSLSFSMNQPLEAKVWWKHRMIHWITLTYLCQISMGSNNNRILRRVIYQIAVVCLEHYHISAFLMAFVFCVNRQHKHYVVSIWLHLHLWFSTFMTHHLIYSGAPNLVLQGAPKMCQKGLGTDFLFLALQIMSMRQQKQQSTAIITECNDNLQLWILI
jgi:hypothetical protein